MYVLSITINTDLIVSTAVLPHLHEMDINGELLTPTSLSRYFYSHFNYIQSTERMKDVYIYILNEILKKLNSSMIGKEIDAITSYQDFVETTSQVSVKKSFINSFSFRHTAIEKQGNTQNKQSSSSHF